MSKELIYKNIDALKPIEKLVVEASSAITDPSRLKSDDAQMNEALVAAGGIGVGGTIGFAALYYGGVAGLSAAGITSGLAAAGALVGGGMTAGIAVIAAPAVLLGIGGYAWVSKRNKRKLLEKKEMLMQEIQRKQNALIDALKKTDRHKKELIIFQI